MSVRSVSRRQADDYNTGQGTLTFGERAQLQKLRRKAKHSTKTKLSLSCLVFEICSESFLNKG